MNNIKRYSIVCYLENEHHDRVRVIQKELLKLTGSRKCLDSWSPHLTIGSGILVTSEKQAEIDKSFLKLTNEKKEFEVLLADFGGTENFKGADGLTPYVLWINVVVNKELQTLFDNIAEAITSKYDTFWPRIIQYVPHVTIAYGDLSAEGYEKGKMYLS